MADLDVDGEPELDAGGFAAWLAEVQGAIRGERDADVPCDGCTACCRSSQFVHIGPDEQDTLAHVPAELLFPAPGLPAGHVLLGYDEQGRCPMLGESGCSIYEHRPRTCRTYDCRIFPAAGVEVDEDDDTKVEIARRTRRWRFTYPTEADQVAHQAVKAAAASLRVHGADLPDGARPRTTTQLAVLAVERCERVL
jgi:Fe-S-cluster containining protein